MDFSTYWKAITTDERERMATFCEVSIGSLRNIAYEDRGAGPALCVLIERFTSGVVSRWDLRPDDWWKNWPELIGAEGAPAVPAEASA